MDILNYLSLVKNEPAALKHLSASTDEGGKKEIVEFNFTKPFSQSLEA